jgi:hypothetical protein
VGVSGTPQMDGDDEGMQAVTKKMIAKRIIAKLRCIGVFELYPY